MFTVYSPELRANTLRPARSSLLAPSRGAAVSASLDPAGAHGFTAAW
jgi:hypothetical protein